MFERSMVIWRRQLGETHPAIAAEWNKLAFIYEKLGRGIGRRVLVSTIARHSRDTSRPRYNRGSGARGAVATEGLS